MIRTGSNINEDDEKGRVCARDCMTASASAAYKSIVCKAGSFESVGKPVIGSHELQLLNFTGAGYGQFGYPFMSLEAICLCFHDVRRDEAALRPSVIGHPHVEKKKPR